VRVSWRRPARVRHWSTLIPEGSAETWCFFSGWLLGPLGRTVLRRLGPRSVAISRRTAARGFICFLAAALKCGGSSHTSGIVSGVEAYRARTVLLVGGGADFSIVLSVGLRADFRGVIFQGWPSSGRPTFRLWLGVTSIQGVFLHGIWSSGSMTGWSGKWAAIDLETS
jgi:hypothetical protein